MLQDKDTVKTGGELPQYRSIPLIAVGSNRPFGGLDATSLVKVAVRRVSEQLGVIRAQSPLYRTPAFPAGAGPDFVNAAFAVNTDAPPQAVIEVLHAVEQELGRQRTNRWEPRTLDLDLIAYGGEVLPNVENFQFWRDLTLDEQMTSVPDTLVLPHPRVQDRAFVLIPLSDIAPDWVHPVLNKSVTEMLRDLSDKEKDEVQRL